MREVRTDYEALKRLTAEELKIFIALCHFKDISKASIDVLAEEFKQHPKQITRIIKGLLKKNFVGNNNTKPLTKAVFYIKKGPHTTEVSNGK